MGYNTSGVYKIDVDGNGPLPPAFVRCDFNPVTGVTSTIVENNLREKYVSKWKKSRRVSDDRWEGLSGREVEEACGRNM